MDKLINQLPIISEITGNEIFPLWGGGYYKSSIDKIKDYIKLNIFSGTSNQFVKGDGSLDNVVYLPKSGGEISNVSQTPLFINSTSELGRVDIVYRYKGNNKALVGYYPEKGASIYNYIANKWLGIKDDGTPYFDNYTLLHSGLGTSSQFLKADGSVDGNSYALSSALANYLPLNGGGLTGSLYLSNNVQKKLLLNNLSTTSDEYFNIISFRQNNVEYGSLGTLGSTVLSWNGNTLWHSGNDGSGSGLDADLLDGKHNGEVAANNLTIVSRITDANSILNKNGIYWVGTEIASNFPNNNAYGTIFQYSNMNVPTSGSNTNYITQLYSVAGADPIIYYRSRASERPWTSWKQFAFIDSNVVSADKLTTKQLTNEDLNEIKSAKLVSYYANGGNSISNIPFSNGYGFVLQVVGLTINYVKQVITRIDNCNSYIRVYNIGAGWTSWKKMLTEDDVKSLNEKIIELENRIKILEGKDDALEMM